MKKLRILLADDHEIVRDGLRLLIDGQPDMLVVGEAATGKEVLTRARELKPDVIVMDLSMPEFSGLQATQRLRAERPEIRIVALTGHEDETYLDELCKAGATGYVLKRSAGEELIQAISDVAKGRLHFEPSLAARLLARRASAAPAKRVLPSAQLSDREREVLTLLAWGHTNKEIAANLALSVKTVETYKLRIADKLSLHSRAEMVQYALVQGWLSDAHAPVTRPRA